MQLGFIGTGEITSSIVNGQARLAPQPTPSGCPLAILLSLISWPAVSGAYLSLN